MENLYFKGITRSLLAIGIAATMASCADTEVVSVDGTPGDEITLNLIAPEGASTRAGSDHKLRFTAKLYKGKYDAANGYQFLEKKQGVITDGDDKCTIVFSVPQGDYSVLLFADYILASGEPDSQGFYEDEYYDTSENNENIRMIAFSTNTSDHSLIHKNCINNENYDCFYYYTGVFNKTEQKYERDCILTRAVSKVRFVSTTPLPQPVKEISFSHFYHYDVYQMFAKSVFHEKAEAQLHLSDYTFTGMSNQEDNELFYFYTLASGTSQNLGEIEFTIKFQDDTERKVNIPSSTVKVRQNYLTTVKGAFLADQEEEKGDIILHLQEDKAWGSSNEVIIP